MPQLLIVLLFLFSSGNLLANDTQTLTQLLDDFLSGQTKAHHEQFWADELVYTSSNGTRFGKAEIMANFTDTTDTPAEPSKTTYSGTELDIRLYDDIAVVAFMLVAKEAGEITQTYYNTGTFQKKSGRWQAIAWQATIIPKAE